MAYPESQKFHDSEDFVSVFHNGRLTFKRIEEPKKLSLPSKEKSEKGNEEEKPTDPKPSRSGDALLRGEPVPPSFPYQVPPPPMFDPWGRPILLHPGGIQQMPFFSPAPDYYRGYDEPRKRSSESSREKSRGKSPRRDSSPRKRIPRPTMEIFKEQKRPSSKRKCSPPRLNKKQKEQDGTMLLDEDDYSKLMDSLEDEKPQKSLTEWQISQRCKQIEYGKVTEGYKKYTSIVPRHLRNIRDPTTPNKDDPCSKRCWCGNVRRWRRQLHEWDNPTKALTTRAAYTRNNEDLRFFGILNEAGEVVVPVSAESSRS